MLFLPSLSFLRQPSGRRSFVASGVAAPRPAKVPGPETATSTPPAAGASLRERIGSFLVGAGLAGIVSQYYIYQELITSNLRIIERQQDLEKRLKTLEKKK